MRHIFLATFAALALVGAFVATPVRAEVTDRSEPEAVSGASSSDTRAWLAGGLGGLLDPARLHFSQSYSLSMGTGGGTSYNAGLYTASLSYQLSDPLLLTLHMGVLHSPFSGLNRNVSIGTQVIPGMDLTWRPSQNFMLSVQVNSPNSYMYSPYNQYGYGMGSPYNSTFGWNSDGYSASGMPLQMGPTGAVEQNPRYPRGGSIVRPSDNGGNGAPLADPWR